MGWFRGMALVLPEAERAPLLMDKLGAEVAAFLDTNWDTTSTG
jgi:hypothetical protein